MIMKNGYLGSILGNDRFLNWRFFLMTVEAARHHHTRIYD